MGADESGTRTRILRATLELIGEGGIASVTNRSVARAAGVSLGSVTYHFDSQATLLRETLDLFIGEEVERVGGLTARIADGDPAAGAEALQNMLRDSPERRIAKLELYLHAARDERLREAALRCFSAYDDLAASTLSALGVEDADAVARVAVAIIDGTQLRRLASGDTDLSIVEPLRLLVRDRDAAG